MDIVEFLRARLDEDEAAARAATWGPWKLDDPNEGSGYAPLWTVTNDAFHNPPADDDAPWLAVEVHTGTKADAAHIARHDPARVLREVEAKQRIMDLHKTSWHEWTSADGMDVNGGPVCDGCSEDPPCPTICTLALPYADHPDYRQEWA